MSRTGTRAFLDASERYDLVVNTSFGNTFANRPPQPVLRALPHAERRSGRRWPRPLAVRRRQPAEPLDRAGARVLAARVLGQRQLDHRRRDPRPRHPPRASGVPLLAHALVAPVPGRPHAVRSRVDVDGRTVFDGRVDPRHDGSPSPRRRRTRVRRAALGHDHERHVRSAHRDRQRRRPCARDRRLARATRSARRCGVRHGEVARLREVRDLQFVSDFLDSYQHVVANSPYTARWVERLGVDRPRLVARRFVCERPVRSARSSWRSGASSRSRPDTRRSRSS